MTIHTGMQTGKRVLLILKDGRHIVSRFIETKRGKVRTRKGDFKIADIRTCCYYNPETHRR